MKINADVRQKLAALGSVWQYYEFVSTQWPSVPYINDKPAEVYDKATLGRQGAGQIPHLLANSTMETYLMGPDCPDKKLFTNTSSCMACHNKAGSARPKSVRTSAFCFRKPSPRRPSERQSQQRRRELTEAFGEAASK